MPKQRIAKGTAGVSDKGVVLKSGLLQGRHLGFGICGGIAAVEVVKIMRELRRHGATVVPYVTPSVTDFVGEVSLAWAAGAPVVSELGPDVDHLNEHDLVLVAPLTLNTLAKSALALADNPVSLLVAAQLGRKKPLLFVPTMNLQLRNHPLYREYRERLESWGAGFLEEGPQEGRLKMPAAVRIVEAVIEELK